LGIRDAVVGWSAPPERDGTGRCWRDNVSNSRLIFRHVSPYDHFAPIYDHFMAVDFAQQIVPALDRLLLNSLPRKSHVLDLCCGTGRVTAAIAQRGFRAAGIDSSPAMLSLARRNAPAATLTLADVRSFRSSRRYAAVVSTFNSFAHVHSPAALTCCFRNVRDALAPGGRFVFDLSMHEQYLRRWRGFYAYRGRDVWCTIRPSYDPALRIATNNITIARQGASAEHRSNVTITQKCHAENEVFSALGMAGLRDIACYDAERDCGIKGESFRSIFVSRR